VESSPSGNTPLDKITPFYFGPSDKQLFGLYHAPQPGQEREVGVVICNPWGQEFVRAHRALSQLALRLARQGFPTLRFDYYATGDSSGEDAEGTLGQWQTDLRAAIQELKRRARVEDVFLAGLRLGASLAALVASGRDDVAGLALWEPAVIGSEYVQDLITWHAEKQSYFLTRTGPPEQGVDPEAPAPAELLGFGLHANLLADLNRLDLLAIKRKPASRILIVENTPTPEGRAAPRSHSPEGGSSPNTRPSVARRQSEPSRPLARRRTLAQLSGHLQALGAGVEYRPLESFKLWTEDPDKGLVPQLILQTMVAWFVQEAA